MKRCILLVTTKTNSLTDFILCSTHSTTFVIHSVLLDLKNSDIQPDWHGLPINAVSAENAQQRTVFTNRLYKNEINTKSIKWKWQVRVANSQLFFPLVVAPAFPPNSWTVYIVKKGTMPRFLLSFLLSLSRRDGPDFGVRARGCRWSSIPQIVSMKLRRIKLKKLLSASGQNVDWVLRTKCWGEYLDTRGRR
jgi:hypothetical protein